MTKAIKILGVEESKHTNLLKSNVQAALLSLDLQLDIEEISDVKQLMEFKISGIPALIVKGQIVSQKNIPGLEDLKLLFRTSFLPNKKHFDMKNILVPTDFSDVAYNAFEYAKGFANQEAANLKVVHVFHPELHSTKLYLENPVMQGLEIKQKQLADFIRQDPANADGNVLTKSNIETEVRVGFPGEDIVKMSREGDPDLIIMGTTGEGGILDKIFGSVSSHVARKAHCPVLLIPPDAKFKGYKKILYAGNHPAADEIMMERLIDFAGLYGANIHFVHINENPKNGYHIQDLYFEQAFRAGVPGIGFNFVRIESRNILEGLKRYAAENKMDMMVMATAHRSFIENVLHESMTKKMIFNTEIPLMIMHFDD